MRKLISFVMLLILVGCTNSLTFPENHEPFVEYEYGAFGPDIIYNLYSTKIIFYGDGIGVITTPINEEIGIDEQAPHTIEFEIDNEAIESLQAEISDSNFFTLPEDLSDIEVVDGGYEYMTVHTVDQSKTVGGDNPHNETLEALSDKVFEMLPDGLLRSFHDGIEEYQREQGLFD